MVVNNKMMCLVVSFSDFSVSFGPKSKFFSIRVMSRNVLDKDQTWTKDQDKGLCLVVTSSV